MSRDNCLFTSLPCLRLIRIRIKTPKIEAHKVTGTILLIKDEDMVMGVSSLLLSMKEGTCHPI